jgi:hypothetical protein
MGFAEEIFTRAGEEAEREAAQAEVTRLARERDEARAEAERQSEECERALRVEREAVLCLGQANATIRLMARTLEEGRLDVAEAIAGHVLRDEPPKVLAEVRDTTTGRAGLAGWPVEMLMRAMGEEIERVGADNYLEWHIAVPDLNLALRVERLTGRSPAQLVVDAKAERDAWKRAAMRGVVDPEDVPIVGVDAASLCNTVAKDRHRQEREAAAAAAVAAERDQAVAKVERLREELAATRAAVARWDAARRTMTAAEAHALDGLADEERELKLAEHAAQWHAALNEAREWNARATEATLERDEARAALASAWQEGAEAMRAAILGDPHMVLSEFDEGRIRALPVPGDGDAR